MHLGLCDAFSAVYPKFEWVEQAAQKLGHTTVRVRSERDMSEANACDLVLFSQNYTIPPTLVASPKVIWVFDLIGHGIGDMLRDYTPWQDFDAVFCKNPQDIEHPHAYWLDQACPDWPRVEYERKYDVILPGRPRKSRIELVKAIRGAGINVAVAGYGWKSVLATGTFAEMPAPDYLGNCLTDGAMQKLFGSAKVIVGDNYADIPGYWSDRRWLAYAAGTPYIEESPDECIGVAIYQRLNHWQMWHHEAIASTVHNRYEHRVQDLLNKVATLDFVGCGNPG